MKRCPQCEFLYEDDQSLCDMDGILLVFDSQQLPVPLTAVPVPVPLPVMKPQGRLRMLPATAALVLATVLTVVYYVSIHQPTSSGKIYSPAGVNEVKLPAPPVEASAGSQVENAPDPDPKVTEKSGEESKGVATSDDAKDAPKPKAASATPTTPREDPKKPKAKAAQPKQDDSKIESFVKKTGRILKKPFKF